jgi:hypothetical protein
MPGLYRQKMREGLTAIGQLHAANHDLERMTLHVRDLECTLYRLAMTILLDKFVDMDAERGLAVPHEEVHTYLSDYWTQAQLYAAIAHAAELTNHVCPACEGLGLESQPCPACNGTGEISERVTNEDRIRALLAGLKPEDLR